MREGHLGAGGPHSLLVVGRNLLTSKDIDALKDRMSVTFHKILFGLCEQFEKGFWFHVFLIHRANPIYHLTVLLLTGVYLEVENLQSHTQNRSLKGFSMGCADYFLQKRPSVVVTFLKMLEPYHGSQLR